MTLYTVRQYRPAFFSGFDNAVVAHIPEADLMNPDMLPWLKNFQHDRFFEFYVEDGYGKEKIISARMNDGTHWVAAIAEPESKP
jgi:hypothetical protein